MCCTKIIATVILAVTGVVLLGLGTGLGWGLFPSLFQTGISDAVALVPGTEAWDVWENTPIPLQFKVYFFNVTNANDVTENGAKPILKEIGPYVYDLWKSKYNITLENNDELASYYQDQNLFFNATLSGDLTEDDLITILNPAMMGAILDADLQYNADSNYPDMTLRIVNKAIPEVFEQGHTVFNTYTVDEWLFAGIPLHCKDAASNNGWILFCKELDQIVQNDPEGVIRPDPPDAVPPMDFLYSFFYPTNATHDGLYTINTGIVDPKLLGSIQKWENESTLPFWAGPECNEIKGTDAAIFPPFLTTESRIDIFSTDLCRSLYAVYQKDVKYKDVPGLRYVASAEQLATAEDNPDNYCWCAEKSGCLKEGSLDLYPCMDAAIVLTFPHFYQGSPDYMKLVDGLTPNQEAHETFLDLEPYTGVPLRGSKRIQFNMMIKPVRNIDITQNLPHALVPLLWVDEGIELDDANSARLKSDVYGVITALQAVRWVLVAAGIGALFAAVFVFCCCC